ncbi:MAG: hypothetical protein LBG11_06460 [Bifidobacteriaceae bacterium]|nr:hypothetical protein [Bifidobacteriaceae bacterium]
MPVLDRRLQLLVDSDRMARLEREAKRQDRTVAAVVRDAIDWHLDSAARRRRAAGLRLLARPIPETPEPEWMEIAAAIEDETLRRTGL